MLRGAFLEELREAVDLCAGLEARLESLHDLAEYDGLSMEVIRRLGAKQRATEHTREALIEIPQMCAEVSAA